MIKFKSNHSDSEERSLKSRRLRTLWTGILISCMGLLGISLSIFLYHLLDEREQRIVLLENRAKVSDVQSLLQLELDRQMQKILALKGFFESSEKVEKEEFASFVESLEINPDIVIGLQWIPQSKEHVQDGRFPIEFGYFEKRKSKVRQIQEPAQRAVLRRVLEKRSASASIFEKVQNFKNVLFVASPVFKEDSVHESKINRSGLIGIVVALFSLPDILKKAFETSSIGLLGLLQFTQRSSFSGLSPTFEFQINNSDLNPFTDNGDRFQFSLRILDRMIDVSGSLRPTALVHFSRNLSLWLFGLILVLTLTLSFLLWKILREKNKIQSEVLSRTRELRNSQKRFQTLSDSTPALIWESDARFHRTYVNKAWLDYTGKTMEENLGNLWQHSVHPEDLLKGLTLIQEALRTHSSIEFEYRVLRHDGVYRWFFCRSVPNFSIHGELLGYIGCCVDIEDRRKAERELYESELRFQQIANHIHHVLWISNATLDGIEYVNPAFEAIWGKTAEDIYKNPEAWIQSVHPEEQDKVKANYSKFAESGSYDDHYRIIRPDGSIRWIHDRGFVVRTDSGKIHRFVGIAIDVTAVKEQMTQLENLTQKLKQSNADLEEFAYAASHDLQEPLRSVHIFIEILKESLPPGVSLTIAEGNLIDIILNSIERMQVLIRSLLDYAQVESKGVRVERVEARDIVDEAIQNLSLTIEETKAKILIDVSEVPTLTVNRAQFVRLFQNLLGNAIKYRKKDWPLKMVIRGKQIGNSVQFFFKDNGQGFDPAQSENIFKVFHRASSSDIPGTGMGLAMCKKIVERHGGEISVTTEPNVGSCFSFTLPLKPLSLSESNDTVRKAHLG